MRTRTSTASRRASTPAWFPPPPERGRELRCRESPTVEPIPDPRACAVAPIDDRLPGLSFGLDLEQFEALVAGGHDDTPRFAATDAADDRSRLATGATVRGTGRPDLEALAPPRRVGPAEADQSVEVDRRTAAQSMRYSDASIFDACVASPVCSSATPSPSVRRVTSRSVPSATSLARSDVRVSSARMAVSARAYTPPVSRPSATSIRQTPVRSSPARRARSTGAAPRQRGNREKWMFTIGQSFEHRAGDDPPVGDDHAEIDVGTGLGRRGRREVVLDRAGRGRVAATLTGLGVGLRRHAPDGDPGG